MKSNRANNCLFGYDNELIGFPIQHVLQITSLEELYSSNVPPVADIAIKRMIGCKKSGELIALGLQTTTWDDPEEGRLYAVILRDTASELEFERSAVDELKRANNAITGAQIGVFEYEPSSGDIVVSDIWRQVLELEPSDKVNVQEEWRSRVHPEDLEAALEPVRLCLEGITERSRCEYRLQSRDRTGWRWMQTDVSVGGRDEDGNVVRLFGAQIDITKQKKTEIELRRNAEQFRSAFENGPIGKAIVGLDGRWLRVNQATCDLFGYSEEELLRTDFQTLTHPDDLEKDLSLLEHLIAGEIPNYEMEKRYFRADGRIMWGLLTVGLVRDSAGNPEHFISQIADITESRRLSELKSEFVATVSHELRTPLTSVLGSLALLAAMEDEPLSDEAKRLLFIAQANGDRLKTLIDDILSFEKFSTNQIELDLSPQNIVGLMKEATSINQEWADRYNVQFKLRSQELAHIGYIDAKRFHQVMANLLSNAAKFSDEGRSVDISVEQQDRKICVTVSNVGAKIPSSFHDQIFKPFSQTALASTRKRGGTGLGLSISKQIVEKMGGEIGYKASLDGHTLFWFTITMDRPTPTDGN